MPDSAVIPTPEHGRIVLTAPESPEYWYQDYGTAELKDGKVHVDLDPILADIIMVDENNPIRVFCTPVPTSLAESSIRSSSVSDFNVAEIFSELAKENYNRTVELTRAFQREAPRASATIAIARTVLEDKKN